MSPLDKDPPVRTGGQLASLLASPEPRRDRGLRFSLCKDSGWLSGTASAVRVCCALWNMRGLVRRAVRLHAALTQDKAAYVKLLMVPGLCNCQTKTPLPEHHALGCPYGALMELGDEK